MRQGHSGATPPKEALLSMLCGWVLQRFVCRDDPYVVLDLNAGNPTYDIDGRIYRGTTMIMLDKLVKIEQRAEVFWCDRSRLVTGRLLEALNNRNQQQSLFQHESPQRVHVVRSENEVFLDGIESVFFQLQLNVRHIRGLVISDSNGIAVPLAGLGRLMKRAHFMDVFIHLCGYKRVWGYWDKYPGTKFMRETGNRVGSLVEIFSTIPKATWLMTDAIRRRGDDHLLLYGTNLRLMPPIRDRYNLPSMFNINSSEGRHILQRNERESMRHHWHDVAIASVR